MRLSGQSRTHPWLAFHHGYTMTNLRMRFYNSLDRWSLPKATKIITVSEAFKRELRKLHIPPARILVLHNAIDPAWASRLTPELRTETRMTLGIEPHEKALLIVGRLSREKSHELLVRALARLARTSGSPPLRLLIAGDGPEREPVQRCAASLGIDDRVIFLGHRSDVLPFYAAADLAVLASRTEGSPNALLEAMAARIPLVATAVGGVPEMVTQDETALLVPPDDEDSMAAAIACALSEPKKAKDMADRAAALVSLRFSPQTRACALKKVYAELARGGVS
jgi:glycosyltransferase involved in cell wall biosynthesis